MMHPGEQQHNPGVATVHTLQQAALGATLKAKGVPGEERALARAWLVHFPDTSPRNVLARLNAFGKRRARNKVARASRKSNRRGGR